MALKMQATMAQGVVCSGAAEINEAPGRNIISFRTNGPPTDPV